MFPEKKRKPFFKRVLNNLFSKVFGKVSENLFFNKVF